MIAVECRDGEPGIDRSTDRITMRRDQASETALPEVPRFAMYSGCVLDQISWQLQRSGC